MLLLIVSFHHAWKVCLVISLCAYMWKVRLYPNISLCAYARVNTVRTIYTYKRVVCVCLFVCLSAFYRPHDSCPLCGAASEWPRAGEPSSRAAPRARAQACTARARARMPYNFSTKKSLR